MTIEEIADRIVLAERLWTEATVLRRKARHLTVAGNDLTHGILPRRGRGRPRKDEGVGEIIAAHVYGAGADQHHQNGNGHAA